MTMSSRKRKRSSLNNVKALSFVLLFKILFLQQFLLVSVLSFVPLYSQQTLVPNYVKSSSSSSSSSVTTTQIRRISVARSKKTRISQRLSSNDDSNIVENTNSKQKQQQQQLNAAIVGAGPSGLLLAHYLLQAGHKVSLYESRTDPRYLTGTTKSGGVKGRAYALGLGKRGRTAIQSVDTQLWEAVKSKGYQCERFDLYLSPTTKIRLRDANKNIEPSVLIYQTELCSALLDELDRRYGSTIVQFHQKVKSIDTHQRTITLEEDNNDDTMTSSFDVIVGCDGVNSVVRQSMMGGNPSLKQQVKQLPGIFKVCRFSSIPTPPNIDPTSVALLLPKGGGKVSTFVTPTSSKGEGCILFSGSDVDDPLLSTNVTAHDIVERFPLLDGLDTEDLASQLNQAVPSVASTVQCNTYHYGRLVLCGDAAHATGGVSGQGANSALVDAAVLADCLIQAGAAGAAGAAVEATASTLSSYLSLDDAIDKSLLTYSQKQVPEGKALYELSIGPGGDVSALQRLRSLFTTARDFIFQGRLGIGKLPLQILLSQSLESFSSIRRDRNSLYPNEFPDSETFQKEIADFYNH